MRSSRTAIAPLARVAQTAGGALELGRANAAGFGSEESSAGGAMNSRVTRSAGAADLAGEKQVERNWQNAQSAPWTGRHPGLELDSTWTAVTSTDPADRLASASDDNEGSAICSAAHATTMTRTHDFHPRVMG